MRVDDRADARTTLVVASLGYFMVILDATIVNIALPTIARIWGRGFGRWSGWSTATRSPLPLRC